MDEAQNSWDAVFMLRNLESRDCLYTKILLIVTKVKFILAMFFVLFLYTEPTRRFGNLLGYGAQSTSPFNMPYNDTANKYYNTVFGVGC